MVFWGKWTRTGHYSRRLTDGCRKAVTVLGIWRRRGLFDKPQSRACVCASAIRSRCSNSVTVHRVYRSREIHLVQRCGAASRLHHCHTRTPSIWNAIAAALVSTDAVVVARKILRSTDANQLLGDWAFHSIFRRISHPSVPSCVMIIGRDLPKHLLHREPLTSHEWVAFVPYQFRISTVNYSVL